MLSRLFIAALWSLEGKGLTAWLLFVMFIVIFLHFPFGILGEVWYLIVSIPDPCCLSYMMQPVFHSVLFTTLYVYTYVLPLIFLHLLCKAYCIICN